MKKLIILAMVFVGLGCASDSPRFHFYDAIDYRYPKDELNTEGIGVPPERPLPQTQGRSYRIPYVPEATPLPLVPTVPVPKHETTYVTITPRPIPE